MASSSQHGRRPQIGYLIGATLLAALAGVAAIAGVDAPLDHWASRGGPGHSLTMTVVKSLEVASGPIIIGAIIWSLPRAVRRTALVRLGLTLAVALPIAGITAWLRWLDVADGVVSVLRLLLGATPLVLMVLLLALYTNGPKLAVGLLLTAILAALITHSFKWSLGRARPQTDLGPAHFQPFHGGDGDFESFPSGHSSHAAVLALTLGIMFPRARIPLWIWVGVIGAERIVSDKHFLSDVAAGYAVGFLAMSITRGVLGSVFFEPSRTPSNQITAKTHPTEATGAEPSPGA